MDRSDVINLITEVQTQKPDYTWTQQEISQEVFCDVRSVTRTEWFEAGRTGIAHPAFIFIINRNEYEGQTIVEYRGQRYGIYRTYEAKNENLELYAEAKGGLHDGKQEDQA